MIRPLLLLFFLVLIPPFCRAETETLVALVQGQTELSATHENDPDTLSLTLKHPELKEAKLEEKENTLVVELPLEVLPGNLSLNCPENPYLERLRFRSETSAGFLDLIFKSDIPTYSWKLTEGTLSLSTVAKAIAIDPAKSKVEAPSPVIITARRLPGIMPVIEKTSGQVLTRISFDHNEGGTPVVRLLFSEQPAYQLIKITDRQYQLLVPEAQPGSKAVALPHFPPGEFEGLTLVHASQQEEGLTVQFGVEAGRKITPLTLKNAIEVGIEELH